MDNFINNLKTLSKKYTQKQLAEKTGFSQSSINNYLSGNSEPSMSFLISLKKAFGINIDEFIFSNFDGEISLGKYEKYIGNYLIYYYNNSSYKGEVHNNLTNTLSYGVLSVVEKQDKTGIEVVSSFSKDRKPSFDLFKKLGKIKNYDDILLSHKETNNFYSGQIHYNNQNVFIELVNKENLDECYIILNNPESNQQYVGGLATINSISRGREHNPCLQFAIISRNILNKTDGEIYNLLQLDYTNIDFKTSISELTDLYNRLYVQKSDLSNCLSDSQKELILENNLKYFFSQIVDANMFRFAKISNKEDDNVYKIIKEGDHVDE